MSDSPTDTIGPWTIKAVATATRKAVIRAAEIEGVTVGQWLERHVAEWTQDGSPRTVEAPAPVSQPDVCQLVDAACTLTQHLGGMPESLAKSAQRMLRRAMSNRVVNPVNTGPRRMGSTPQQPAALLPSRREEPRPVNGEARTSE